MKYSKQRTCAVCRQDYYFCPKCQKDKPLFMFAFCSENCCKIYDATSKFENGQISATSAKEQIEQLDLSKIDSFGGSYKTSIDKIMETASFSAMEARDKYD